jgi:hypothetical protein
LQARAARPVIAWLLFCLLLNGCGAVYGTITVGRRLDAAKLAQIKPGVTTMAEILQWFGPPDYVVDGRQTVIDEPAFLAETPMDFKASHRPLRPVPMRALRAPEGSVILIYSAVEAQSGRAIAASGLLAQESTQARAGEVFIFLSKETRKITELAVGVPTKDR